MQLLDKHVLYKSSSHTLGGWTGGGTGGYLPHHACLVIKGTGGGADPLRPARRSMYQLARFCLLHRKLTNNINETVQCFVRKWKLFFNVIITSNSYSKLKESFKERFSCNSSVNDSSFSAMTGHLIKMIFGLIQDF